MKEEERRTVNRGGGGKDQREELGGQCYLQEEERITMKRGEEKNFTCKQEGEIKAVKEGGRKDQSEDKGRKM